MRTVAPRLGGPEHMAGEDRLDVMPVTFALVRTPHGPAVCTRWTFTDEERQAIAAGADLFLIAHLDDRPLPDVTMMVGPPAITPDPE